MTAKPASRALSRGSKVAPVLLLTAVVAGCSITSRDTHQGDITGHMRCVKAHDLFHDDGDGGPLQEKVVTVCDLWLPTPTPEATHAP